MKIKLMSLLLLAGVIIISGCVDREAQPLTSKATENFYARIFYPFSEFQDHPDDGIPGLDEPEGHPSHPSKTSYVLVVQNLEDATSLLDRNIEKAETISLRLEEGIQQFKAEGKDVSKLEALLKKYNLLIEEAKNNRTLANSAVDKENNISTSNSDLEDNFSVSTSREYLIESQKSMIEANIVLKQIFEELHRLEPGNEEINSTSRLSAAGDGRVSLFGNFTLNLHLEEGDVIIPYLSPDSEIKITGNYNFEKDTEMQDNMRVYHINSADMNISGSRKTVELRGVNISLNVSEGEGSAFFLGNGTYRIEAKDGIIKEQKWAKPFPREGISLDKKHDDRKESDLIEHHRKKSDVSFMKS
jgi:hypothetical protein